MSKPLLSKPLTPDDLERAALGYLERFAASAESLRRVLMRRVRRSELASGGDEAEGKAIVADILERFTRAGLIDDARYAEAKVQSLHRRGLPLNAIGRWLAARGVDGETVDTALSALAAASAESGSDADVEAARAFVRRRRLGPWRREEERAAMRQRDLAALGRAGFSLSAARAALDDEAR